MCTKHETVELVKCDYCELEYPLDDTLVFNLPNNEDVCVCLNNGCDDYFWEHHYYCDHGCNTYHPFEIGYKGNFFHYRNDFICPECAMSSVSEREYFVNDLRDCYEPIIIDENKFLPNELSGFSLVAKFVGKQTITDDFPPFRELIDKLISDGFYYAPVALIWGYDHGYFVSFFVDFSCYEEYDDLVSHYTTDYKQS